MGALGCSTPFSLRSCPALPNHRLSPSHPFHSIAISSPCLPTVPSSLFQVPSSSFLVPSETLLLGHLSVCQPRWLAWLVLSCHGSVPHSCFTSTSCCIVLPHQPRASCCPFFSFTVDYHRFSPYTAEHTDSYLILSRALQPVGLHWAPASASGEPRFTSLHAALLVLTTLAPIQTPIPLPCRCST